MKKIFPTILKLFIPLLIGVGILWYLYKGQSLQDMKQVLHSGVEWKWFILSFLFAVLSHVGRAYRWKLQFKSLHRNPSLYDLSNSIFGNYGVNLILPRLGEVWRCNYVSQNQQLPFSVTLGTMVAERFFDLISMIVITVVTILFQLPFFINYLQQHPSISASLKHLIASPWIYAGVIVLVLLFFLFRKFFFESKLYIRLREIWKNLLSGIQTIRYMDRKGSYIFLTFGIWLLYFLGTYVCIFAFDFTKDISPLNALTLFVMGSLCVVIPVQGSIGPWHFMTISTLILLGIDQTQAATFALIVHAIQQSFVILLGIYAFIAIQLGNRFRKKVQLTV